MDGFFSVDEMKLFALWMIFRLLQILEETFFPFLWTEVKLFVLWMKIIRPG